MLLSKLLNKIKTRLNRPKRYRNLFHIIKEIKPKTIMEIGTYSGNRALQMITAAQKFHSPLEISYYGFDLFEKLTDKKFGEEYSKRPPNKKEVSRLLEKTGSNINLYQGDTVITIPQVINKLPKMDFVFIDGGHSLDTITNDWHYVQQLMNKNTIVIFDDYWNREDAGAKPILDNIDRKKFNVKILKPQDKFKKDWGVLKINFGKVWLKSYL